MGFFNRRRLFIFLISFILFVTLIGLSLNSRENLSKPEQAIKDSVSWSQQLIHTPVKSISNFFLNIKDFRKTYEENKELKEKIASYEGIDYEIEKLKEDNEQLRQTLEKTEESVMDFNPIQATVISRSPERWLEQVTINRGREHGIEENMAVITAEGMVGKINSTSKYTSTVQLLTGFDQFTRISAAIYHGDGKETIGLVEEYDKEKDVLMFRIIDDSKDDAKEGDLVLSSGMGGIFPSGLVIGKVKELVPDQYGLTSMAHVEPIANTNDINHVIVVDRTLETDDEEGDESS